MYKVDRLSRSLHDFARMVDIFDKHNVSFVSVTQQFNTTTSMGRLTLNVLLSFAQFEREVTGERIRDKIAASKKKGMWMGGFVPLGYDLKERKLLINSEEAKTIRHIFQRYLDIRCVRLLKEELDRDGIRSKTRTKKDGTIIEGYSFSRGGLYKILSNPVYISQIRHKELRHPGQHEPIIDQLLWDAVQAQLKDNAPLLQGHTRKTMPSLLAGKLFDVSGDHMAPSHSAKHGRRYRYYVSYGLKNGIAEQNKHGWRVPAHEIEQTIVQAARRILNDRLSMSAVLQELAVATHHIPAVLDAACNLCKEPDHTDAIIKLIKRADLRQDGIRLDISLESLMPADSNNKGVSITHDVPMQMRRRGVEMRLVIEGADNSKTDPTLIRTIARARTWFDNLISGQEKSIASIAARAGVSEIYVSNLLPVAFLSPAIVNAIIEGDQAVDLTSDVLTKRINLPLVWAEQKHILN